MSSAASLSLATMTQTSLASLTRPKPVRYSQIVKQPLEWLWPNVIALGKLTFLVGEPGLGKGFLTVDLAARVSHGAVWPYQPKRRTPPASAIMLHAEDDPYDTMPDRLEAAGADMDKIITFEMPTDDLDSGGPRPFSLRHDLGALGAALAKHPDCRLLVIDPISAYLGGADGNHNHQIRSLLYPLAEMARSYRLAVVIVAHLSKRPSANSLNRVMGALSFVATARAVWGVMRDPKDSDQRLLLSIKSNVAAECQGMSFRLQQATGQNSPHVVWGAEPVSMSFQEACSRPPRFQLAERKYWDTEDFVTKRLREELADGPKDCLNLRLSVPGSEEQQDRAAERLGVKKVKTGFVFGWTWMLPEHYPKWQQERETKRLEQARERKERHNARGRRRRAQEREARKQNTQTDGTYLERVRKRLKTKTQPTDVSASAPEICEKDKRASVESDTGLSQPFRTLFTSTVPGVPSEQIAEEYGQKLQNVVDLAQVKKLERQIRRVQRSIGDQRQTGDGVAASG